MLKRRDIIFIQHEENATKLFGNTVNIEGGVNYFLKVDKFNIIFLANLSLIL